MHRLGTRLHLWRAGRHGRRLIPLRALGGRLLQQEAYTCLR
jgi:hypothetical protein